MVQKVQGKLAARDGASGPKVQGKRYVVQENIYGDSWFERRFKFMVRKVHGK